MCVAENTLRGVSVELSAFGGQQRRRTQRSFLEKVARPLFRQSQEEVAASSFRALCILCNVFCVENMPAMQLPYHARPVKSKFRSNLAFFEALCYSVNGASALRRCHSTVGVSEHPDL